MSYSCRDVKPTLADTNTILVCRERDDALRAAAAASEQSDRNAEHAQRKHSKSSSALKRLEADVNKLSSQVTALEHANRSVPDSFSHC